MRTILFCILPVLIMGCSSGKHILIVKDNTAYTECNKYKQVCSKWKTIEAFRCAKMNKKGQCVKAEYYPLNVCDKYNNVRDYTCNDEGQRVVQDDVMSFCKKVVKSDEEKEKYIIIHGAVQMYCNEYILRTDNSIENSLDFYN
ncbi:hypothetical protein [Maridesulfovibrio bastinii]|uniref:hypothetical protein n=1 Tax=Maridesulfovibrio bastinii TaxID=47157 RepID=UPI0004810B42|nr:hypothetical protein [Maridesulfovibrio bastinii]